jgi:fucose permease
MFALSSLGGATVPWLVGALSSRFGSLRVGLTVPLLGCVVMLFLYLKNRHSQSAHVATGTLACPKRSPVDKI